ncbi:hypothetical protein AHAS_Ahas11G0100500 [Arachis hypogaea]
MKWVEKLFYKISTSVVRDDVKYDSFVLDNDKDLQVLFHCCRQFPEMRTHELLAKLGDVVYSSGGSNRNSQFVTILKVSSLMPVSASSFVFVIAPEVVLVASSFFAADLNRDGDEEIGDN